jgi:hypothetical protein
MPLQKYPFVRFGYPDGQVDERARISLPILVTNFHTGDWAVAWGLVDTGADACLFPAKLARDLGHDLKASGVKVSVTSGIEQTEVVIYKHTFRLELLSIDLKRVVWRSKAMEIDCAESNPPALLGVDNFLCRFKVIIDYPKEVIRLQW